MPFINLLAPTTYNVKQYGSLGDGSTDDTAAITAALTSATTTGGIVFFPPGTYITGPQTLVTGVILQGSGPYATTLKLRAAANADLLSANTSSINLSASQGTSSTGGVYNFAIRDMTLDGNYSNQASGPSYPLRFYGYQYSIQNVVIKHGYSGGVLTDWNGGAVTPTADSDAFCLWDNVLIHNNNAIGFQTGGPTDCHLVSVHSFNNGSHCFHLAPNAAAMLATGCHAWGPTTGVTAASWLIETGSCSFVNCSAEGSDTCEVVLLGNDNTWIGGRIFGNPGLYSTTGIQLGQTTGTTLYPGQIYQSAGAPTNVTSGGSNIKTKILRCEGSHGSLWFANEGGNSTYDVNVYLTTGSVYTGTFPESSTFYLNASGNTQTGTGATSGTFNIALDSKFALEVTDKTNDVFNVNAYDKIVQLANGTTFKMYSDDFSTATLQLAGGTVDFAQSSSAAAIASSGTITTSGVGVARVAPTGNVTGIILQAGTQPGQMVTVVNESAFTLTLNTTPATSNVADSATEAAIVANCARAYVWDSSTSRWYNIRGA